MSAAQPARLVVGRLQLEQLVSRLGRRDREILASLGRVRVLTGAQLTRLHFCDLSPHTRDRVRRRVMGRLVELGVVAPLERQVGGVHAGSAGLVYALAAPGTRVLTLVAADQAEATPTRARRPWTPGRTFLAHALAVSELYVQLVEAERYGSLSIDTYVSEPASWLPSSLGGFLKPDAYMLVHAGEVEDAWAIEIDRATESLTTLRRKLLAYVDFAYAGQVGPHGVTPRVFVTVPHERRFNDVRLVVNDLPEPAERLIHVSLFDRAVYLLINLLKE